MSKYMSVAKIKPAKVRKVSVSASLDEDLVKMLHRLSIHEKRSFSNLINNALRKCYRMGAVPNEKEIEKKAEPIIPPPIRKKLERTDRD